MFLECITASCMQQCNLNNLNWAHLHSSSHHPLASPALPPLPLLILLPRACLCRSRSWKTFLLTLVLQIGFWVRPKTHTHTYKPANTHTVTPLWLQPGKDSSRAHALCPSAAFFYVMGTMQPKKNKKNQRNTICEKMTKILLANK